MNNDAIIALLNNILMSKYKIMLTYIRNGDVLLSLSRDGIFKHFAEHIEEERDSIYQINKKLISMYEHVPQISALEIPELKDPSIKECITMLALMEQELIKAWTDLGVATKEDFVLNSFAQEGVLIDQAHLEDLYRYASAIDKN